MQSLSRYAQVRGILRTYGEREANETPIIPHRFDEEQLRNRSAVATLERVPKTVSQLPSLTDLRPKSDRCVFKGTKTFGFADRVHVDGQVNH